MGEHEDAEIERRSQGMVDGVKPVCYWRQRPTVGQLADRVEQLEHRVTELERRPVE